MSADLHARLERLLKTLGCDLGASECQGMLCGVLCGPQAFDVRAWLTHLSGYDDISAYSAPESSALIEELLETTRAALEGDDLDFVLLLPTDGEPLSERASAFGAWCRGFLSGFGLSGIADLNVLDDDARGFLNDIDRFCAIAGVDESDEDDERAFTELTEFARMGVMLTFEQTQVLERDPSSPLH